MKAFFRTFYVPANASLVIAGDFDPARAKALVEKYFGPIPRSPRPPPPAVQTLPVTRQIRETLTDDVQLSRLLVGVIAPPAGSDEAFAYDVVQEILSGGKTSRLYRCAGLRAPAWHRRSTWPPTGRPSGAPRSSG